MPAPAATKDPFLEGTDEFGGLDTRVTPGEFDEATAEENLTPEQLAALQEAQEAEDAKNSAQPAPAATATTVPAAEPKVHKLEDGSSVTIEGNEANGFTATLDPGPDGGGVQVFHGKTEPELMRAAFVAQLNATRKIRSQNRELKLRGPAEQPKEPAAVEPKTLTADEVFEIKTQLSSNPDLALETWFQKKTGLSLDALVKLAKKGSEAEETLDASLCLQEARAFTASHPRWSGSVDNRRLLYGYLTREKLGIELTDKNEEEVTRTLSKNGFYTREYLHEAYEALVADGLLELEPEKPPAAVPAVAPVVPAPLVATEEPAPARGIPGRVVGARARAALGLRAAQTTQVAPAEQSASALSVEELEDLSDEQINALMKKARDARRKELAQR